MGYKLPMPQKCIFRRMFLSRERTARWKILKRAILFLCVFFLLSAESFAFTEAAYRRTLQSIVRLNKECSKLDKAILAKQHFRLAEKQLPLTAQPSGRHLILLLEDETGDAYFFKQSYTPKIEEVAGFFFRLAGADIPANYTVFLNLNGEMTPGSLQTFLRNQEVLTDAMLLSLGALDIEYIQRQQVLDWLYSNFEVQFLREKNTGKVTGIDKDDAFWGLGLKKSRLSEYDLFNRGYGTGIYSRFWQLYKEGALRVDLGVIFGMIYFLQDVDDLVFAEQYRGLLAEKLHLPHFITDEALVDAVLKEVKVAIKGSGGFHVLNRDDRAAIIERVSCVGGFNVDEKEYIRLALARKKTLRTDFTEFYSALAKARGEAFVVPKEQAKFDYAVNVEGYLREKIAQRKVKLALLARRGRKGGKGSKDIKVMTSPLGRHYLIRYAAGKTGLGETISALERLSENIRSSEEALAVFIYLLVLKSDKVVDKLGLLDRVVVLDPRTLDEVRIKELYFECAGTEAELNHPDLRRLLDLYGKTAKSGSL